MKDFSDENGDPLELRLMLQVPAVEPTKNVGVDAAARYEMNEEDKHLKKKIEELVNHKMELFNREEVVSKKSKKKRSRPSTSTSTSTNKDENEKKQKKKKKQKAEERLKELISEEMKGTELKLVIEKTLYATDLAKHQNRLSMPINQLHTLDFLTSNERQLLDIPRGQFHVPFYYMFLGKLQMHTKPMTLIKWHLKTTSNYVLKTNWYHFVKNNSHHLTLNTKVQVWSFRRDHQLCFALACLD